MENVIIARKSWKNAAMKNAAAFIKMMPNGKVYVTGKVFEGFRASPGPETGVITEMPHLLTYEVKAPSFSWTTPRKSPELEAFCNEVWQKAKEANSWFDYTL
ncbi:MAG: hypothetical protein E7020_00155 [Alphaproteobacteria bacterium]|nr:hypothetical protein [Alphaproteobacteria bacterium]